MAYNTKLEELIDAAVKRWQNVERRRCSPCTRASTRKRWVQAARVGYLLKGHMAFGIHKDFLIVRIPRVWSMKRQATVKYPVALF